MLQPRIQLGLYLCAQVGAQLLIGLDDHARRERAGAGFERADNGAVPPQLAMLAERDGGSLRRGEALRTGMEFAFQRAHGSDAQRFAVNAFGARVWREAEAVELAHHLAADRHRAGIVEFQIQLFIVAQRAHQDARAPVDETLREGFVQCVR